MDLETARRSIQATLERMRASYLRPVFDEWAILSLPSQTRGIIAYSGPRPDVFRRDLPKDAEPLRAITAGKKYTEGDLEFVADASDTRYDAFMKVGPTSFLVLNNTTKTISGIRADSKWLSAQGVLFELSEKFRADPLAT